MSEVFNPPSDVPLKLNIGCGGAWYVNGWIGIDQQATAAIWQQTIEPRYIDLDVRKGLPFPTNSVDVIFSSHALEHFTYEEAILILFEMYRVLKVGAPLCLVVPDLDLYISHFVARHTEFLTTPEIIGGMPRGNFTDNFLMNFYSDPKFNNTCHKYSYNVENLSHTLRLVGFEDIEQVPFHEFSYWPELISPDFRSPIPHIERFSLSLQCRKNNFNPEYPTLPVYQEAQTFAGVQHEKEDPAQHVSSLLVLNQALTASNDKAAAVTNELQAEVQLKSEIIERLQEDVRARTDENSGLRASIGALEADIDRLRTQLDRTIQEKDKIIKQSSLQTREINRLKGEIRQHIHQAQSVEMDLAAKTQSFQNRLEELRQVNAQVQKALDQVLHGRELSTIGHKRKWTVATADIKPERKRDREQAFLARLATQNNSRAIEVVSGNKSPATLLRRVKTFRENAHMQTLIAELGLFDPQWYLSRNPDVAQAGLSALSHYRRFGYIEGRDPHPLFAGEWYFAQYPEARSRGMNPLTDYLERGVLNAYDPHPIFDTDWYVAQNPRLVREGANPLAHYVRFWATEGCNPHPLFDNDWYLAQYPDVAQAGINPLVHYVLHGGLEGRKPHPLFDGEWYLREYRDVAAAGINPLIHYIRHGAFEGRNPHPLFDSSWYLTEYPDVAAAGVNPLIHYIYAGEGRSPSPLFDAEWYLRQYPEVAEAGVNPLLDYIQKGAKDGRDPNPLFDTDWYLNQYRDVVRQSNPLEHYVLYGAMAGNDPSPLFETEWYRTQYADVAMARIDPLAHYLRFGAREGRQSKSTVPKAKQTGIPPRESMAPDQIMEKVLAQSATDPIVSVKASAEPYSPLISVILPTYNTPVRYLEDVIGSIRKQTYEGWELCIVDDGSTQAECIQYLKTEAAKHSKIRIEFRATNGGIAEASQQALDMARGEFVAFVDHDDMLATNALAEAVELLREDSSVAMIYTDHAMMDENGTLLTPALKPAWSPEFFLSTNYIVHFKVIRRSVVMEVGGFSNTIHIAQDIGMTCKLAARNVKIRHLAKVLYYWRTHSQSVATGTSAKPAIENAAIATYNAYLKEQGVQAKVIWPDHYRRCKVGVYKLDFPNVNSGRPAIVVAAIHHPLALDILQAQLEKTDYSPLPPVHILTTDASLLSIECPFHIHVVRTQDEFNDVVKDIDCDTLIFLSPTAKLLSSAWLTELLGYFLLSPAIGGVGGKILDTYLRVRSGGLLLLNDIHPICFGQNDLADGYWYNNRIASNVEAVSSRLLATRKQLYQTLGGIPFFEYGDAAGIAYCLKLGASGYRVVYTPWSKIIDSGPDYMPSSLKKMLNVNFGKSARNDRYYHPMYSRDAPYTLA